jgi:Spy/CpxP family protein refolding chaperone
MLKTIAIATTATLMTAAPVAFAADTSSNTAAMTHPAAADLKSMTDTRINVIKAALQLTSDQEKYWPAVEDAIRNRAKNRQARWERMAELRDGAASDAIGDRNLIEIMQRRAEALTQRGNDLKKVADAWEPLYKTLSPDQKKRMAVVAVIGFRGVRDTIERNVASEDDDD